MKTGDARAAMEPTEVSAMLRIIPGKARANTGCLAAGCNSQPASREKKHTDEPAADQILRRKFPPRNDGNVPPLFSSAAPFPQPNASGDQSSFLEPTENPLSGR